MCGIVGLFLKNPSLRSKLGAHLETMLIGMTERGRTAQASPSITVRSLTTAVS